MGDRTTRAVTNSLLTVLSIGLAPVTGGLSLIGAGYAVARECADASIKTRHVSVRNMISDRDECIDNRVVWVEVRYCHIFCDKDGDVVGELADAGATLAGRALAMTGKACHHWFVLIAVEGMDGYVYLDKHSYRNIEKRDDNKGKNGNGDKWLSSERELFSSARSGITLRELIEYVKSDEHQWYHLIDDNCQHFAMKLYNKIVYG
jgi:hypothetical protein